MRENISRFFFKIIPLFLIFALASSQVYAQAAPQASGAGNSSAGIDTRGALGTILVSGLVGGIIGLSTLSFYSKPEKHIRNITWGAGIGMITAAIYLTVDVAQTAAYQNATKTSFYVFPDDHFKVANLGMSTRF